MSTNPLITLNKKLTGLTVEMRAVPVRMVLAAAIAVEKSVSQVIGQDAPRRQVARGPVGVKHVVLSPSATSPRVLVKATGALHLLANPTDAHDIDVKHPHGRRYSVRAQALRTPFGPKSKVHHPGTKGKNTWQRGVDRARPAVVEVAEHAAEQAVRAAFR